MAWRRLLGMLVMMSHAGCLLPPPIEPREETRNNAPRVVDVSPRTHGGFIAIDDCNDQPFFAIVTDPDPAETLYYRWFLDYARNTPEQRDTEVRQVRIGTGGGQQAIVQFSVKPSDLRFGARYTEPHFIELLISDRPFEVPLEPEAEDAYRVPEADGLADSYVWVAQIAEDACP